MKACAARSNNKHATEFVAATR